jgi:mxaA protein
MNVFVLVFLALFPALSAAASTPYEMRVYNPEKKFGYVVGDIIHRSVELEVKTPYTLTPGSTPTRGVMRKGIELREAKLTTRKTAEQTTYRLDLVYLVFTRADTAHTFELPMEKLQLVRNGQRVPVVVPPWRFQVSPLAAHGEKYIEKDMSPYRPPILVEISYLRWGLLLFLGVILVAFAGLTYINADATWFPGMGGPFAMSYRKIADLPEDAASAADAVAAIHQAFRQTFGENLFPQNLDEFVGRHPGFMALRSEMATFFEATNHLLYGAPATMPASSQLAALREFCRRCRDCERGVA